jgi:uncharacterized protein (DUF486 family)
MSWQFLVTTGLLIISNIFMTFAWYGHLRFKHIGILSVIVVSWLIAFLEYCFQVPANRLGHSVMSAAQLKALQEIITLIVFSGFSIFYLKEAITINQVIGFVFIVIAGYFIFKTP